jgi:4-hydroxy-2-oxoheptanedioate aldolase
MELPRNTFKEALQSGRLQIGMWLGLADPYTAELLACTGFDWLAIDAEHAPNDVRSVLSQLQAVAPYPVNAVVRTPSADITVLKQYLDVGAQTLLVPMVESAEQARRIVAGTRYPPAGVRGVGSALARASRWNLVDNYLGANAQELCVVVQVESAVGLENLAAIVAVEGIDGVFFGPADLAASMDMLGRSGDQRVQDAIRHGISVVRDGGKAAGVLSVDASLARSYVDAGAVFVAVGVDTTMLVQAAKQLLGQFKPSAGG